MTISKVEQIRSITITPAHNGYMVQVGCKVFVFETAANLIGHLMNYMARGIHYEKEIIGRDFEAASLSVPQEYEVRPIDRIRPPRPEECGTTAPTAGPDSLQQAQGRSL
jgi:hypothetical protein